MKRAIYDLSVPFTRDMPTYFFWKNRFHPPFFAVFQDLQETSLGPNTGGTYTTLVAFLTHTGTHFEVPRHYLKKGWYLHEVPLDRFWGEGPVLRIPKSPDEDITPEELEATGVEVRRGDLVIIDTGWYKKYTAPGDDWEAAKYYFLHNPGLGQEAAQWLVDRGVHTVLIDAPSIDSAPHMPFGDKSRRAHMVLFEHNIPVVELMGGDFEAVAQKRCAISCAPVNFVNGEAFPVRVLVSPLT